MKRHADDSVASRSLPMVSWPNFSSRLAIMEARLAFPCALAVAVQASLHVRGAGFYGRQGVGHRQIRVVVRMNPEDAGEAGSHFPDDFSKKAGVGSAVRIAQAKDVRAGVLRGCERLQRIDGDWRDSRRRSAPRS